ncbi:neuronal acetylcholine receptor subunit alpha-3-like [Pecten maximus]|uniref:neuronal acetylcholine receptor subunit alpha-3-like n=1 Tax=Pecten maximus TaxID=6579 RepID=UPI001458529B|nr:neuronal acetylcholine receptor subunit alpha-3-like [Pecten maximus]
MVDFKRLMSDMFTNYSKEARPVENFNETVEIQTVFCPLSLLDVNEVSGTISLSIILCMYWKDPQLVWVPSDYGGITETMVNSSMLWKPSVFLISSASDLEPIGSDRFDARITSSGDISWCPGRMITSSCSIDMTEFPTDSQNCSVLLLPWGYSSAEIKLLPLMSTFYMKMYSTNGEWSLDKSLAQEYLGMGPEVSIIGFSMILTRRSTYFVISMIIPIYLLCFLNPFVFLLPAASGERISYTITMFLSLAVYMTLIGDNMPKVSETIAGISYFILVSMIFSGVIIILTIFTLRCEAVAEVDKFPTWLITLLKKKKAIRQFKIECKNDSKNMTTPNPVPSLGTENICSVFEEDTKEGQPGSIEMHYPEKIDVMNFIDIVLFCISQTIAIAMIFGFSFGYYK